jgi:hypothetical protein
LGADGESGAIFTNFILAVGLEHDIFFVTDRNLTDCLHTGSRAISALHRGDVRMRTAITVGLLVRLSFTDPIEADPAIHGWHPHRQQVGSHFLFHRLADNSH